ncbi:Twin-arginine translocation pathway signal [Embleya sp. NPDC127516]|uniref:Twin-arginine translocation pathway signal n=1 Tax=Embleya sp. NPDC127516 TaxID=3363990 RepID=UPI00380EB73A
MAIRRTPNTRLRAVREERWKQSRSEFALALQAKADELGERHASVDARLIARWEDGETARPRPMYRRLLVALTAMSEAELGIGPVDSPAPVNDPPPTPVGESVDRRRSVGGGALAISAGAWPGTARAAQPRRVDPALVDYFEEQLAGHYRADMMLGPRALIGTVTSQLHLIGNLLKEAESAVRRRLSGTGSAYAAFAGWLHLDAGDTALAAQWHGVATELAHRSGNAHAVACSLVDRAMAHTDAGAGAAAVDLCANVLTVGRRLPTELRVFALQQQAHGASLLGDRTRTDRLLDRAEHLVGNVDEEVWGTACLRTPHYVQVQRATCYGRLGLHADANRLWQQVIPASGGSARRDVGVWSARQARARAGLGEPEAALQSARVAVDAALGTGSVRAARELAALEREMQAWHDHSIGRELAALLAPLTLEA